MKQAIWGVVAIASLSLMVWVFKNNAANQKEAQDYPDLIQWVCQDKGHKFGKTIEEVGEAMKSTGIMPCPECSSTNTIRAEALADPGRK
jgi:hypothetical protein